MSPEPPAEDAWIRALADLLPRSPRVRVGIGHDVAAVEVEGRTVVVKTDTVVDGVDVVLAECGGRAAARKAVAVTLSDFAAAASIPRACLVSVVLPRGVDEALWRELALGLADAAREFDCPVVGGDTSVADGPLTLAVFAFGEPGPMGCLTRAGARPGDVWSVTGPLGGSILGRHLTFRPRLVEAQVLARARVPHAMTDLSDGLSSDLARVCVASGVGADLDAAAIPLHDDARVPRDGRTPLARALDDGEDFELLLAHAPLDAATTRALAADGVVLHAIGRATGDAGRVRLIEEGVARDLPPGGFDHLRRAAAPS